MLYQCSELVTVCTTQEHGIVSRQRKETFLFLRLSDLVRIISDGLSSGYRDNVTGAWI